MANISPVDAINNGHAAAYGSIVVTWPNMQNGDVGLPSGIDTTVYSDVSYQVEGTFGAGGNVAVMGSNDKTNFYPLHNAQGVTIGFTQGGIAAVLEAVVQSVPQVTAGDGTTSVTVIAFYRRTY